MRRAGTHWWCSRCRKAGFDAHACDAHIRTAGGLESLIEERLAIPSPASGEALVRVEFAGVNFIAIYKRTGLYKVPLPSTLGEEGAGTVVSVGDGVTNVRAGDRNDGKLLTSPIAPPGRRCLRRALAGLLALVCRPLCHERSRLKRRMRM